MKAVVVEPPERGELSRAVLAVGVVVLASVVSAADALVLVAQGADVVVADFALPGFAVVDVCRDLRATSRVPIVVVGEGDASSDAVVVLEAGADDFVRMHHGPAELIARIRAAVRRRGELDGFTATRSSETIVQVGDLTLDRRRHETYVGVDKVHLSPKEFDLLALLLSEAGTVVHRDVLITAVWGPDYVGDTKTLDTHIKRLRAKIEMDPARPTRIVTVRGRGFLYDGTPGAAPDAAAQLLHS